MRLIQGIGKRAWKMDCCIWQKTRGLYFPWPRRRASSSDDGPANEPSAEILGCRGGARSQEARKRIFTTDEGSPHLEWHRRYRGSPGALGPHEDRVNGYLMMDSNRRASEFPWGSHSKGHAQPSEWMKPIQSLNE